MNKYKKTALILASGLVFSGASFAADLSTFTTAIGTEQADLLGAVGTTLAAGLGIGSLILGARIAWKSFKTMAK